MTVILPRQQTCVMCGNPILGQGRIDRLYCKASCRNLAWRFRTGKRRGKTKADAQGEVHRRRSALLRHAWGQSGELRAARIRVAELQAQLAREQKRTAEAEKQLAAVREELQKERADRKVEQERPSVARLAAGEHARDSAVLLSGLHPSQSRAVPVTMAPPQAEAGSGRGSVGAARPQLDAQRLANEPSEERQQHEETKQRRAREPDRLGKDPARRSPAVRKSFDLLGPLIKRRPPS